MGNERVIPRSRWRWTGGPVWVDCCPGCGVTMRLDHEVDAAGVISPSLDCPLCSYHESGVVLDGWAIRK